MQRAWCIELVCIRLRKKVHKTYGNGKKLVPIHPPGHVWRENARAKCRVTARSKQREPCKPRGKTFIKWVNIYDSSTVLQPSFGLGSRYLEASLERVELLGTELVRINLRIDFTCGEAGTEYSQ